MVKISNCCQCCDSKAEKDEIKRRALNSVQMLYSTEGKSYYPDGAGTVTVPLPTPEDLIQLRTDKESISQLGEDIERLEGVDTGLRADLETLKSKEAADVAELKTADAGLSERVSDNADQIAATASDLQATEKAVAANQSKIANVEAESAAIAKSLVSDVMMSDGTTAGSVQVSIEREDGALITSKNYAWGKSVGCRLEAGTQEGYIKTLIDLSDGTVIESNEYKIVEVLESDVYVTAITLVPNPTAGTIGGTISYSNGTTQSINAVNVPTAPGVTNAIEALQARMTAAEQKDTAQDASLQSLNTRVKAIEDTPGVGQFGAGKLGTIAGSAVDGRVKAEDDGTGSVNGWNAVKTDVGTLKTDVGTLKSDVGTLKTDVSQLKISDAEHTETLATQATQISAQATEISEVKSTQTQHTNQIRECIDEVSLGADGSSLDFTTVGGQTSNISIPASKPKIYTGNLSSLFNVTQNDSAISITNDVSFIFEILYIRKGITIEQSSTIINPFSLSDTISAFSTYEAKLAITKVPSSSYNIFISIQIKGTSVGGPKTEIKVTNGQTNSPSFSQLTTVALPVSNNSEKWVYRILTL